MDKLVVARPRHRRRVCNDIVLENQRKLRSVHCIVQYQWFIIEKHLSKRRERQFDVSTKLSRGLQHIGEGK